MSMIDWNAYHQQVLAGVAEIAALSPDVIRGYQAIGGAARKTNLLGTKVNETFFAGWTQGQTGLRKPNAILEILKLFRELAGQIW